MNTDTNLDLAFLVAQLLKYKYKNILLDTFQVRSFNVKCTVFIAQQYRNIGISNYQG